MKALLYLTILLCLSISSASAFDPPSCEDPWYYQSNDRGLTFMIPDKAQHYWGSYALCSIGQKYLGDEVGPLAAFTLGFLWEVKDSKTSLGLNNGVVGFSYKDLIADGAGVLSSLINQSETVKLWVDYSTLNKEITLNISIRY